MSVFVFAYTLTPILKILFCGLFLGPVSWTFFEGVISPDCSLMSNSQKIEFSGLRRCFSGNSQRNNWHS